MIEYMLIIERAFAEHFTEPEKQRFVSNRMQFRYPLAKVEIVDIYV
jgi:hypothetical protein